jgi:hypothetical protein
MNTCKVVIPGLAEREPGTHDRVTGVVLVSGFRARPLAAPE